MFRRSNLRPFCPPGGTSGILDNWCWGRNWDHSVPLVEQVGFWITDADKRRIEECWQKQTRRRNWRLRTKVPRCCTTVFPSELPWLKRSKRYIYIFIYIYMLFVPFDWFRTCLTSTCYSTYRDRHWTNTVISNPIVFDIIFMLAHFLMKKTTCPPGCIYNWRP